MKHLIWSAILLAACGGGGTGPSAADLEKAREEARAMRAWGEFVEALPEGLGEARVEAEFHTWAVPDGDQCKLLKVQKMGEMVGSAEILTGPCP